MDVGLLNIILQGLVFGEVITVIATINQEGKANRITIAIRTIN